MGIIDRIKRRLPILGQPEAPAPSPVRAAAPRPAPRVVHEEPEEAKSPRGDTAPLEFIDKTVKGNTLVLFMKGTPNAPQCGFSAGAAGILAQYGKPFVHVNVVADPEVREAVKEYTSWPTLPQIFVGGEFVGGADILKQMHESGDLKKAIDAAFAAGPTIPAPSASPTPEA